MKDNKLAIEYDNFDLQLTSCEKVLGVHIDDNLKPRSHEGLRPCCGLCKTSHVVKSQVDLIRARDRS